MIMIIIVMRFQEGLHGPAWKARHCSHCFQNDLASPGAGFFLRLNGSPDFLNGTLSFHQIF